MRKYFLRINKRLEMECGVQPSNFIYINQYFADYIENRSECTFPRKVRQVKPGEGGWYVKE
jgi:hypothetical protein